MPRSRWSRAFWTKIRATSQALRAAVRTHERTGHYEEALAQLRLILQHTRRGTPALSVAIDIAVLLEQRLRRPAEALAAYREAHRADPAHPVPLQEIRRLLLVTGDHRALAEELVGLAGSAPVPAQKALLFAEAAEIYDDRLDEIDRAIALLNQARTLLPNEEAILDRLERAYLRRGKVGDLVALLDARLASAPPGAKRRLKFFLGIPLGGGQGSRTSGDALGGDRGGGAREPGGIAPSSSTRFAAPRNGRSWQRCCGAKRRRSRIRTRGSGPSTK